MSSCLEDGVEAVEEGKQQDLEELVQFMELQESAEKSSMAKAKAQNNNGSQNGGNQAGSNKRKGDSGQNGGSSKKAKKHCDLCAKNGAPANSHNTDDCRIYMADGSKKGQSRGEKKSNHSFAQLEKKLDKKMKKLDKLTKKMERLYKKRSKEESDSDSDAWGCESGSIEEVVVDVCTDVSPCKTKKQNFHNSSSPIKTTQLEPNSSGFQYEQSSHSSLLKSKGVTAVMALLVEPTGDQPGRPT